MTTAFKTVLVVDDDEVARNLIAANLRRLGMTDLDLLEDGEAAWEAVKTKTYDLIVLDWKLPKLSGLALFNRIRSRPTYRTTPLLVVSGLLDRHDFRLLQEFPCTALLEKPFNQGLFENRITELKQEADWYSQNTAVVDGILDAVKNDSKKAEALLKQLLKKAPHAISIVLVAARRLVQGRMFKAAQNVLEAVLKLDEGCIMAMSELGKALHLQGLHKEALSVLRRANKLSPQNLQRLCLTGQVELNLEDPENAQACFEKALAIDAEDAKAQAGVVVAGNLQELLAAPEPMQVPHSFASLLNTMGVAFVRSGQFAKGIEQYRSALAFLTEKDDAARVAFNLGLGFLRWGKPANALPWFQRAETLAPEGFGKAAGYVRQILVSGTAEDKSVQEADFAGLAEMPLEQTPVTTPETAAAPVPSPAPEDQGGGKVIPFPAPSAEAEEEEPEELEEEVGNQVVL